jgi:NADPH:quinone reductase-like Zn-dependent oxidoreductase
MEPLTAPIAEPVAEPHGTMKAAIRDRYCSPAGVELREVDKPAPTEDEVLVRVRAVSVNISDWYGVTGRPWVGRVAMGLLKPKESSLGTDYAGVVEAVGANVTDFRPGDEVFGGRSGCYAEYVCARADRGIVLKPANATFEEAAAVPVAALTALQGIRDKGGLEPGQKVLINGASGGVGTYAVQIAKALGGDVTAVCSTGNVDTARSLGADRVVDYTQEDFTRSGERYDLFVDVAGSRSWRACKRVLAPKATVVVVGGPKSSRLLGPLGHVVTFRLAAVGSGRKIVFFIARFNKEDMETLRALLAEGKIRSVIDRRYELRDIREALEYMGEGHAKGKIVLTV